MYILIMLIFINSNLVFAILANNQTVEEKTLVAAYIERFTRFIEWGPTSEVNKNNTPFIIGVYQDNSLVEIFENTYINQKIKNKNIKVVLIENMNNLKNINILYLPPGKYSNLDNIILICKKESILSVGFSQGLAEKGVIINLYKDNKNLKFEINEKIADEAGLKISYLLLQKAKIVLQGQ